MHLPQCHLHSLIGAVRGLHNRNSATTEPVRISVRPIGI